MNWSTLVFLLASLQISLSFMLPLKTTDGSVNLGRIVTQLTLLEQMVTTQNTEISALKTKVGLLQSQLGASHLTSEVNSLKDELFATKTELRSVSNEVISVNTGLKTLTSQYTNLQIQINDTDNVVQNVHVSLESEMQLLNSSLVNQISTTQTIIGEISSNKQALEKVNASLLGDVGHLKQTTTKTITHLERSLTYFQGKFNSSLRTLQTKGQLLDKIAYDLNMTTRDTSLLKSDVTIMNQRVADLTRNMHTTSNTMSTLSSRISHMNATVQTQTALVRGQANQNTNSLRTFQANLVTVNSTLSHTTMVLRTAVNSVFVSVKDQEKELGALLKRFNATSKDTSLLKTDVALLNSKILTMTKLKTDVALMNNKLLTLTRNLQTTSQTVSRLSPIVNRLNVEVSFEVYNPVPFVSGSIMKFSSTRHNIGSGYHSSTGQFVAPVAGTYLFWTQIDKQSGTRMTVTLYTRGGSAFSYLPVDGDVTGTVIAAVVLGVGDTAYVKTSATEIYASDYSTFGGILLRRH